MNTLVLLLLLSVIFHDGTLVPVVTATAMEREQEGSETSATNNNNNRVPIEVDPDTSCSDAYRKKTTKEVCLSTKDHFLRPCCFCEDKKGNDYCYNQDEAKWASLFGDKCEYRPDNATM